MSELEIKPTEWIPALITVNVGLLVFYLTKDPNRHGLTDNSLMYLLPWMLIFTFVGIVILTALDYGKIKKLFSKVSRNTWILLGFILLAGLYLRTVVVPHTHRIFFDEDLYVGIGNSIASEGKAIMCNRGYPDRCVEGILNKEPNGYPVLVGVLYFIFGRGEWIVYAMEAALGTLSIALVFLAAYLLFESERTALYSAFVFALIPSHIVWSGSLGAEVVATFFALAAVLYALLYLKTGNNRLLLATAFVTAYATQIRPESGLIIPIVCLLVALNDKRILKKAATYGFWIPWIALILLIIPHMIHLAHANRTYNWGASEGKISVKYLDRNLSVNTSFLVDGVNHPTAFTVFAVLGLVYMLAYRWRALLPLFAWFAIFFGLYAVFYSGSFDSGGIGHRFALIVSAPLAFFAGYGMHAVTEIGGRAGGRKLAAVAALAIILASLYSFWGTLPFIKTPDHQAQYAREMHDFAVEYAKQLAPNCHILEHTPSIFLVNNRPSLQTWFGGNKMVMDPLFSETDCVYYMEGAWCLFEPHKSGVCKNMHNTYNLTAEWSMTRDEDKSQVFTLYRVRRK